MGIVVLLACSWLCYISAFNNMIVLGACVCRPVSLCQKRRPYESELPNLGKSGASSQGVF